MLTLFLKENRRLRSIRRRELRFGYIQQIRKRGDIKKRVNFPVKVSI